jgi:hypothetical protein
MSPIFSKKGKEEVMKPRFPFSCPRIEKEGQFSPPSQAPSETVITLDNNNGLRYY